MARHRFPEATQLSVPPIRYRNRAIDENCFGRMEACYSGNDPSKVESPTSISVLTLSVYQTVYELSAVLKAIDSS